MDAQENTLVACCWYDPAYPEKPLNALGVLSGKVQRHRKDRFDTWRVQLVIPEDLAGRFVTIQEGEFVPLLNNVNPKEAAKRYPEAILSLASAYHKKVNEK